MATLIPSIFAQSGWYSLWFIASRLGKPERTVYHWAKRGLFLRMGLKVIYVRSKGSGRARIWVHVPDVSKLAMLKNLPLDIPSTSTVISPSARSLTRSGTPPLC